jgi:RHH-type proline utilization regulon transcriptional repressor/proline dehydrogenase/delta 1-pyrroline-5-carboxylate dehydrogenase
VLHLVRYARKTWTRLLDQINATGYGLTLGVHTRIDETIARVVNRAHAGNVYVNRNMVGAVVGVQPFGGEGLSGTGPKAGGPLYLLRLLSQRPADALARTFADADRATPPEDAVRERLLAPLATLQQWAQLQGNCSLGQHLPALCPANPKRHRPHPARPHGRAQCLHPGPARPRAVPGAKR